MASHSELSTLSNQLQRDGNEQRPECQLDHRPRLSQEAEFESRRLGQNQGQQIANGCAHAKPAPALGQQDDDGGGGGGLKYRIGYWWSDKKSQKLNADKLRALFAERNCEFVKLDFDRHLDQQGPFHLIVHKISDILVKAGQGDQAAKRTIGAFESYVRKHPETIVLDPLDNNRALLDRYKQYRLIEQSDLAKENVVFTPPFVHLTSTNIDVNRGRIRRSKITFPIVCKPILAQGSQGAHQMCIIFNEAGLKDVKPPCVAQSFVNHNAKLFKLFVIKDKYYTMERPSLKNFQADDRETVFFFSHDISKPNSSSSLTELDEIDKQNLIELLAKWSTSGVAPSPKRSLLSSIAEVDSDLEAAGKAGRANLREESDCDDWGGGKETYCDNSKLKQADSEICPVEGKKQQQQQQAQQAQQFLSPLKPNDEILGKIVRIFSEKLGLTFYGIDIIIEHGTNRYAIIDMNTFPGYDGVDDFLTIFCDVVCNAIPREHDLNLSGQQQQQTRLLSTKRKPTEHDSGIEST